MLKNVFTFIILFCLFETKAQSNFPLKTTDFENQEKWADSILQSMTLDEKVGQLFMIQAYSNKDEFHKEQIAATISKYHIGGLIFMQGTPIKQAELTNFYQSISNTPLLIGFDGEWGLDMRLQDTYRYPWNMTLGAVQDNKFIEMMGEQIGEHCARLGIHINFAPVVDVNINPQNPIIGNRSFGENRENVTQKSIAFTKGLQSKHVIANAKHFPGHGDTDSDSHKMLPKLDFDKKRLDSIELYPYKYLFNNKLGSVMVAHLSVAALEPDHNLPTSLSKNVVTNLLQHQLGFNGLILTDALNMKGASNFANPGELDLQAIIAGNDILLIPENVGAAVEKIKEAISKNVISEERINASVKKILLAKYWVGLHENNPIDTNNLIEDLNAYKNDLLHFNLVENSITLVKNTNDIVPIKHLQTKKIAYVKLGDSYNNTYQEYLNKYEDVDEISGKSIDEILQKLTPYNLVIVGFHTSNQNPWKSYKFNNNELVWLQEIARVKKVILNVFASPYSLLQLKSVTNIEGILISYQNSNFAQQVSPQILFGALPAVGKLPVSINDFKEGTSIQTKPIGRLSFGFPEEVGMKINQLQKIDSVAEMIISKKMSPGLQVLVARKGKVIFQKAYGKHTYDSNKNVENSDLYDVASLTKILVATPILIKLVDNQLLHLDNTLGEVYPKAKGTNKEKITLKEALSHQAMLKPWIPFYIETLDSISKKPSDSYYRTELAEDFSIKVADRLYLKNDYPEVIIDSILQSDLLEKGESKYSDLFFYIAKDFLEKIYKKRLDTLSQDLLFKPLGANRTTYNPLNKFDKNEIVPTEEDTYFRNQLIHGYVHDMGAAMFGGVGAHAGLFTNALDVAKLMQLYLQKGYYGGDYFFNSTTFDSFNKRYYADLNNRKAVGFDKLSLDEDVKNTCGCISDLSFGHSGFTGTFTWADPESEIIYVFLSNRIHPTVDNKLLLRENIRTEIQQIIQDAIIE